MVNLFKVGRYDESLRYFREVLARSPENEDAKRYAQLAERLSGSRKKKAGATPYLTP